MLSKTIEIRDDGTHIGAVALYLTPMSREQYYSIHRAGYHLSPPIGLILIRLSDGEGHNDSNDWKSTTMQRAHNWLQAVINSGCFLYILDGFVLDVQYEYGETDRRKASDRFHPTIYEDELPRELSPRLFPALAAFRERFLAEISRKKSK